MPTSARSCDRACSRGVRACPRTCSRGASHLSPTVLNRACAQANMCPMTSSANATFGGAASMHSLRSALNIKGRLSVLVLQQHMGTNADGKRAASPTQCTLAAPSCLYVRVMPGSSSMRACIDAYSPLITFSSTHHLTPYVHAAELKHLHPHLDCDPHLDWTHTACSSGRTSLLVPFHTESRPWR